MHVLTPMPGFAVVCLRLVAHSKSEVSSGFLIHVASSSPKRCQEKGMDRSDASQNRSLIHITRRHGIDGYLMFNSRSNARHVHLVGGGVEEPKA